MGSFFSSNAYAATAPSDVSPMTRIHSSASWKSIFDAHKDSNRLMVVDFWAAWCGPCRMIEPAIIQMAKKFTDVNFVMIDVDELREVMMEFNVESMPTFVFFKKGKEVDRVVGAKTDELANKIEKYRANES